MFYHVPTPLVIIFYAVPPIFVIGIVIHLWTARKNWTWSREGILALAGLGIIIGSLVLFGTLRRQGRLEARQEAALRVERQELANQAKYYHLPPPNYDHIPLPPDNNGFTQP